MGDGNTFGEVGEAYAQRLRTWRDGLNELKAHRDSNNVAYFTDEAHDNLVNLLTEVALFLSDPDDEMTMEQVRLEKQMLSHKDYSKSRDYEDDPDGPPDEIPPGEAKTLQERDPLGGSLVYRL